MRRAQNRVKPLIPANSNVSSSTNPKLAQKSDWEVSNKLEHIRKEINWRVWWIKWSKFGLLGKPTPNETSITSFMIRKSPWKGVAFGLLQVGVVPEQLIQS